MIHEKMKNAVSHFEKELSSLRTSRANPKMLDSIMVEAYGNKNPINQVGNVTVPDASTISIQVWDVSLIKNVENSIIESNLGIKVIYTRDEDTFVPLWKRTQIANDSSGKLFISENF